MRKRAPVKSVCTFALLLLGVLSSGAPLAADETVNIDQGWSNEQKSVWYTRSQGSRLLPLTWLRAFEEPDGTGLLLDRVNIEKFRYLANASPGKGQLPVGFAIDEQNDLRFSPITKLRWKKKQSDHEPWVGMNCAACHTAEITFNGKRMRIEGGPTLANFQGFMVALNRALVATQEDAGKWDRFAAAVLAGADTPANRGLLKAALGKLTDWLVKVEVVNHTPLEYGFGRLDAFGHIFNKVLLRTEAGVQPTNPSDAPVSYPFLWNIHQQDKVQWNGIAPNIPLTPMLDIGALGRNVGEVTGVFADLTLKRIGPAITGYTTSARVKNLVLLEQLVTSLKPPVWPNVFPAIDAAKWEVGKALFTKEPGGCASCHAPLQRDDLKTRIDVTMTRLIGSQAIGTDPWMACNAYTYQAQSGLLEGTPKKFFIVPPSPLLKKTAPLSDLLGTAVTGSIWYRKGELLNSVEQALKNNVPFEAKRGIALVQPSAFAVDLIQPNLSEDKLARLRRCLSEDSPVLAYKGRPLNGIWATPPFLHNGAVPTLYDLLLPPVSRPEVFPVGTREFDPERVGYVTDKSREAYRTERAAQENTFMFRSVDAEGRVIPGNSNRGHDYGNSTFTEEQRWALVEYMKAVGGRRDGDKIVP